MVACQSQCLSTVWYWPGWFAKFAIKPKITINYKIGVQEYVSACLRTSEGVLTDDDGWKEASHGNSSDRSIHPNINDLGLLIRAWCESPSLRRQGRSLLALVIWDTKIELSRKTTFQKQRIESLRWDTWDSGRRNSGNFFYPSKDINCIAGDTIRWPPFQFSLSKNTISLLFFLHEENDRPWLYKSNIITRSIVTATHRAELLAPTSSSRLKRCELCLRRFFPPALLL